MPTLELRIVVAVQFNTETQPCNNDESEFIKINNIVVFTITKK